MTDTVPAEDVLATRRKKLLWRATHRGMKEMDLLLGEYAKKALPAMGAAELDEFADILAVADAQLLDWLTDKTATPAQFHTDIFAAIKSQHFIVSDYKKL